MSTNASATRIRLRSVAISYPYVLVPQQNDRGEFQYSATFVFPKNEFLDANVKACNAAIDAALVQKYGAGAEARLSTRGGAFATPMHMGAEQMRDSKDPTKFRYAPEQFAGWIAARTPGKATVEEAKPSKPQIAFGHEDPAQPGSGKPQLMTDAEIAKLIYPGALVNVTLSFYTYANKKSGVGVGLQNIQLVGQGPRLDNRTNAQDDFEVVSSLADVDDLMG